MDSIPPAGLVDQPPRNLVRPQPSVQDVPKIRDDLLSQPIILMIAVGQFSVVDLATVNGGNPVLDDSRPPMVKVEMTDLAQAGAVRRSAWPEHRVSV